VTWGNGGPHSGSWWFHGRMGSPVRFRRGAPHIGSDQGKRWSPSRSMRHARPENPSVVGMRSGGAGLSGILSISLSSVVVWLAGRFPSGHGCIAVDERIPGRRTRVVCLVGWRVPWSGGNEGLVVNLGDVMELARALICLNSLNHVQDGGREPGEASRAAGRSRRRWSGPRTCSASTWPPSASWPPRSSRTSTPTGHRAGA
jgi:hypothetical protein